MDFVNYFDVVIISIIIILALKGLFTGLIREACSILGIIGGILVASKFSVDFGVWLNSFLKLQSQTLVNLIGFMVILGFIWIASLFLAEGLVGLFRLTKIKFEKLNRILGVLFAGSKAFLILSVILFTFSEIHLLSNFTNRLKETSFCYPIMIKAGDFIVKQDVISSTADTITNDAKNKAIEIGDQVLDSMRDPIQ